MSRFKWYRKWRGGYWIYEHFNGWRKVEKGEYQRTQQGRCGSPAWSMEAY